MEQTIESMNSRVEELLEKPFYVIDFLPEQVKPDARGQFFDVECYLLNSDKHIFLKDKFVNIILKLMCYYRVSIQYDDWIDRPSPQRVVEAINTIMNNHSGWLNILLLEENVLVVFEWDSLNLTVYNPSRKVQTLMQKIACSEGLFWWKPE